MLHSFPFQRGIFCDFFVSRLPSNRTKNSRFDLWKGPEAFHSVPMQFRSLFKFQYSLAELLLSKWTICSRSLLAQGKN